MRKKSPDSRQEAEIFPFFLHAEMFPLWIATKQFQKCPGGASLDFIDQTLRSSVYPTEQETLSKWERMFSARLTVSFMEGSFRIGRLFP